MTLQTQRWWHYTTCRALKSILSDGDLRANTRRLPRHEQGVVWLSAHGVWEPTASKGLIDDFGMKRMATLQEMIDYPEGIGRIEVRSDAIVRWPELRHRIGMRNSTARKLEAAARKYGATPSQWAGVVGDVEATDFGLVQRLELRDEAVIAIPFA